MLLFAGDISTTDASRTRTDAGNILLTAEKTEHKLGVTRNKAKQ
jgi:hypothetical protein